jgi:hypothetical protein
VQAVQAAPPQSTSVSVPFFTPSVQAGNAQIEFLHTPLEQSEPIAQPAPSTHTAHVPPPQSTSVSSPF